MIGYTIITMLIIVAQYLHVTHYQTVYYPLLVGWVLKHVYVSFFIFAALMLGWLCVALLMVYDAFYHLISRRWRGFLWRVILVSVAVLSMFLLKPSLDNFINYFAHIDTTTRDNHVYHLARYVPYFACVVPDDGGIGCGLGGEDYLLYECGADGVFCTLIQTDQRRSRYWSIISPHGWDYDPDTNILTIPLENGDPLTFTFIPRASAFP